jgi:hypothetical protein
MGRRIRLLRGKRIPIGSKWAEDLAEWDVVQSYVREVRESLQKVRRDLADHKRGNAIDPSLQQGVGRLLFQCESKGHIRQGCRSEGARCCAGAGVVWIGPLLQAAEFGHAEGELHRGGGWYV